MYAWCPSEMWSQFAPSPVTTRGCSHAQRLREKNLDKKINGYNLEMKIKLDSTLKIKKIKKLWDRIFYVPQKWAPPTVGSQPHGNLLTKPNRVILVVFRRLCQLISERNERFLWHLLSLTSILVHQHTNMLTLHSILSF